jgi:carboxylesterase type B
VPLHYANYFNATQKIVGDYMMTCPNRRFAGWHAATGRAGDGNASTYTYFFDEIPGAVASRRGAFHGAEIRFVFFDPTYLVGWAEKQLSLLMLR